MRAAGLKFGVANDQLNPCLAASRGDLVNVSSSLVGLAAIGVNSGLLMGSTATGVGSRTASATVAGLKVTVAPGLWLTVDALAATATSQLVDCDVLATTTWSSMIGKVTVNGVPITVTNTPAVVDLIVAKLYLGDVQTVGGTITVRPIYLALPGTGLDVAIGEVIAGAACGPLP